MWWTQGVAKAIQTCQQHNSVFIILVEPSNAVMYKHHTASETPQHMLSRLATTSMHKITFSQPPLRDAIHAAKAVCLKFPCEKDNVDFTHFSAFFKLVGTPPNLYFISPNTGETLILKTGFVSPKTFVDALVLATEQVSGRKIPTPTLQTPQSATLALQRLADQIKRDHDEQQLKSKDKPHPVQPAASPNQSDSVSTSRNPSSTQNPSVQTKYTSKSMTLPSPSPTSTTNSQSRLLARFPDGKHARKTFPASTYFSTVRAWLAEQVRKPTTAITVATAFPRRVFDLADNPKMLSELGLVPTETLVVSVESATTDTTSPEQSPGAPAVAGIRSYASGALQVVGGFFRSFVADAPEALDNQNPRWGAAAARPAAAAQMPRPLRMDGNRVRRNVTEDDDNLLSNGNSTQYGWNPRQDEDE